MTQGTFSNTSTGAEQRPLLVCLLPARNAEKDLPRYLASVSTFCDAIVALDDGSTDGTYEILETHPLVKVLLRNPVRHDYRDWDDAANRNRLLSAAQSLQPQWLISLDADERFDEVDAASLRTFLQTDALPGFAYGFRHVPMRNDEDHFLPQYQWVYRLFSAGEGQHFPPQKLHFIPIPTVIPRYRWIKTTLRIQHFGGLTAEHRLTRFHKYLEADPLRTYQADYSHLLEAPAKEDVRRWQPRPGNMPVLLDGASGDLPGDMEEIGDAAPPSLSAIIISRNDELTIADTVASVVNQEVDEPFEVIVVTSGSDRTAEIVRNTFPAVTVVELSKPSLPGEARNAGLAVARGHYITFPGSHIELLPGSLAARLQAHRRGYAMVTGVVLNGTPTPAGWASYFLDHHAGLPGHGPAEFDGPPGNCSYARLPLLEVGAFPEEVRTAEDTAVNRALARRGYVAYRSPDVQYIHRSPCTSVPRLIRHHFQRGRGSGRLLLAEYRETGHLLNETVIRTRLIEAIPTRLQRIEQGVARASRDIMAEYERHRNLVALGAVATWAGMWYEILRPTRGKLSVLLGRPVVNLLMISGKGEASAVALVQIDHVSGMATMRSLSSQLVVPHNGRTGPIKELLPDPQRRDTSDELLNARHAVGEALNLDNLECIVAPEMELPGLPTSVSVESDRSPGPREYLDGIWSSLVTLRAIRQFKVRSTLSVWDTVTVLNRIRTHAVTRSTSSTTDFG